VCWFVAKRLAAHIMQSSITEAQTKSGMVSPAQLKEHFGEIVESFYRLAYVGGKLVMTDNNGGVV